MPFPEDDVQKKPNSSPDILPMEPKIAKFNERHLND